MNAGAASIHTREAAPSDTAEQEATDCWAETRLSRVSQSHIEAVTAHQLDRVMFPCLDGPSDTLRDVLDRLIQLSLVSFSNLSPINHNGFTRFN